MFPRRLISHPLLAAVLLLGSAGAWAAEAFGLDQVAQRAKELAAAPYKPAQPVLAPELRDIGYDAYRDIRFKTDHALWRGEKLPFELMFFPTSHAYREAVKIHTVDAGGVHALPFDASMFDFGRTKLTPAQAKTVDYAGFRVHAAINSPSYKDEVVLFLGASYFRAVGQKQIYGLSARGLAVDTAAAGGEEFPRFTEFWIEKPKAGAKAITVYGLLDSARVAGAYRFVVTPGKETTMQVQARVYAREGANAKFGFAPLTSMFQFGSNQPNAGGDDYRPEVHDSDGLSLENGDGQWLWRPLVNPQRLLVTSFQATHPRGFGLMQRERDPRSYEDPEALYERRPSLWVQPQGAWGKGRVELVQIPTPDETNDNIVAYWIPDAGPQPKQAFDIGYTLRWQLEGTVPQNLGWVTQTRRGRGYVRKPDGDIQYVVDFDGPALRKLGAQAALVPVVDVGANGELREKNLFRNRVSGAWRLTVRVKRADPAKPIELRAFLQAPVKQGALAPVTETWTSIVPSDSEKP